MTPRRLIEPARLASTAVLRGQSDERLIDLTRAGNQRAFEAIVHRYRRPLLRHCSRILPAGRAEDAVQQAFLSAYNAIANGDGELKLRPWLYRIAHNSALNLLRQNGWNHEQLDDQFDGVLRPDQALEARERIRSLVRSVKGLPERQREAIVLRELEGRSYEEIAAALGVTDGAVRQLLNRARSTLRAGATALTPYGLLERLAEVGSGAGGAGAAVSLAKLGTAVLVTGAVATGAANHGVPGLNGSSRHGGDRAAESGSGATGAPAGVLQLATAPSHPENAVLEHRRHDAKRPHHGRSRHEGHSGPNRSGDHGPAMVDEHSGGDDRHSGSGSSGGGGEHSGSGSGETSSGSSGKDSGGSDDVMSGTSGTSGSSGSGSSGSDGSGSSSGPGSSGSGDGGGTSGSSGSDDSTTTTPTDGTH